VQFAVSQKLMQSKCIQSDIIGIQKWEVWIQRVAENNDEFMPKHSPPDIKVNENMFILRLGCSTKSNHNDVVRPVSVYSYLLNIVISF